MSKEMDLRQEVAKLVKEARVMLDLIDKDKREFTAEEKTKYERIDTEIDERNSRIEKEMRQTKLEGDMSRIIDEPIKPVPDDPVKPTDVRASKEYEENFNRYLMTGVNRGLIDKDVDSRALQMDDAPSGGFTVAPQEFIAQLIKAMDNQVFIRPLAKVISIPKAESVGAPSLDADPEDATWSGEITTRDEDTAMKFGKRELRPHPCNKLLKVSKKLIRASALNVESLVRDRLAYKFSVTEEKAFLTGDGAQQPLGVFVASDDGIGTGQDVSTGNTTTEIKFDGLIEAQYSLKAGYHSSGIWIFHRIGVKQIRKLKDGEGRYIWAPSVQVGKPSTILNQPVYMSEYAPSTFTTGKYVGIFGDFSNYWIADALDMAIQTLIELYAATNQNGYIALKETDGMPVLAEAFARVKLA